MPLRGFCTHSTALLAATFLHAVRANLCLGVLVMLLCFCVVALLRVLPDRCWFAGEGTMYERYEAQYFCRLWRSVEAANLTALDFNGDFVLYAALPFELRGAPQATPFMHRLS